MDCWWLEPSLVIVGFLFTGLGLWYNFLMTQKIANNDLHHQKLDLQEIKLDLKEIKTFQIKQDERLARVEGFLSATKTFQKE
jgi:hypothetical protein